MVEGRREPSVADERPRRGAEANFLKLLVGLDAIAVDRQILRFVREAGVDLKPPDVVEAILTKAGKRLRLSGAQVDQLVWRSLAPPTAGSRTRKTRLCMANCRMLNDFANRRAGVSAHREILAIFDKHAGLDSKVTLSR
jgi:hypothetical protein